MIDLNSPSVKEFSGFYAKQNVKMYTKETVLFFKYRTFNIEILHFNRDPRH